MQAPNPVAFTLFGLDVRWYGLLIGLGFFLAILLCYKRAPKHGIESEHILDFAIWLIPMSIIGARAYYELFNLAGQAQTLSGSNRFLIRYALLAGTFFCRAASY